MAVIEEIIRVESDNSLSFGDYKTEDKKKIDGFEVNGNIYKVKTHNKITKIEKNGKLLLESVPGSTIHNFKFNEKVVLLNIEGYEDTQVTIELEPDTEYKIFIDSVNLGRMKSNFSGKINFSVELSNKVQEVKIEKV